MSNQYDSLKLDNQLCFPLYACSREIIKIYKPFLDKIDLTYTQYIAMMVLWENKQMNVKEMGHKLHLDSGTLTPLLKKMEQKGLLTRARDKNDERVVIVTITPAGEALKDKALEVPQGMQSCVKLTDEEARVLYKLLYKLMDCCAE